MAAILKRLEMSTEEICSMLGNAFKKQPVAIGAYLGTSMLLKRNATQMHLSFSFGEKDEGYLVCYVVNNIYHNGEAFINRQIDDTWDHKEPYCEPEEEIEYILQFVNK